MPPRLFARALLALALLGLGTFATPSVAWADESTAIKLSDEGRLAFERKDYRTAAAKFEDAFREAPRGAVMFNAGLSWDLAKDRPRAADAFVKALARADLRPDEAAQAQKRLDEIRKELAVLDLRGPATSRVTVAHLKDAPLPVRVFVTPGAHHIVATKTSVADRNVSVTAGQELVVTFEAAAAPTSPSPARPKADESASSSSTQRTVGFVVLGGGVVFAGAAVILGLSALSAKDEFTRDLTNANAHDRAASLRLWTNISWAAAAAAGITGAVLVFTAPSSAATTATTTTLTLSAEGARLTGTF